MIVVMLLLTATPTDSEPPFVEPPQSFHGRSALMLHDLGSGAADAITPVPGNVNSGVERCCLTDTLYVSTKGWTGPAGMRLKKSDAGEWTGALAAILREIAAHTGMALIFVEQQDCDNPLEVGGAFERTLAYHCVLSSSKATVPLAQLTTLWAGLHHGKDLIYQEVYLTTSLMETDSVGLLHVKRKADYGIWQVAHTQMISAHSPYLHLTRFTPPRRPLAAYTHSDVSRLSRRRCAPHSTTRSGLHCS